MKNRYLSTRIMAIMMAAAMAVSAAPAAFAAERADSETIKEDNQPAADADSDTQEDADAQDSADADKTADAEGTKTEYPLTITTYDYDGNEIETTYEKAPEKVLAVYQGSIETMLALGLEDRLVATAGLDNEVPDELKDAFSKTNYLDEFTPSLETVTMLEPDMILSWSSLFSDKNLGNVTDWIDKGCNTYYNTNTRPDGDRTLENEFTDILNLGKIFDVQDKAQAIVDDAKAVIDKTLTATEDVRKKPGGIYMMVKVAVPEKFKLRIVPNVRTVLFGGQQEIHYIGGSEVLPPPLENEKEREVVRWLGTDRDEKARKILIEHNLRLVVYIAKKFDNTGVGVEDLISIGTIGLIKAINTFNPSKKIKLATYASRCIENEILMYLRRNSKTKMEVSIDEPLNVDWDGNELLLSDILGTEEDTIYRDLEDEAERKILFRALNKLSGREKLIVRMRFGLDHPEGKEMTQKEVADQLGISQSYISRLEKKIMHRLRMEMVRYE